MKAKPVNAICRGTLTATVILLGFQADAAAEHAFQNSNSHAASEQGISLHQFGTVEPTDWAYQALNQLIETHGCVADHSGGSFRAEQAMTRFEAAALLLACLDRVSNLSDALRRLLETFQPELSVLLDRVEGLETRLALVAAQPFSSTTKLSVRATMVLGGNAFPGTAANTTGNSIDIAGQGVLPLSNALTFNDDIKLVLDSSFNGQDLLRTELRAGNFDGRNNAFGGGGPSTLSTLETAFQEPLGAHIVDLYKLYYQFPIGGSFTATLGGIVGQDDMVAFWPSVYPDSMVLDVMTMAGLPVAYNYTRGPGMGLWWQSNGWSISASYVATNASEGSPAQGGIGTQEAESSATLQLGFHREQWGVALAYAAVQNDDDIIPYGTNFLRAAIDANEGLTHAFGLSGYWQPSHSGWMPSISAGWGFNQTTTNRPVVPAGSLLSSQSWSVGLQWLDALAKGNAAGMALGQAPFATRLTGGITPNDGNWMWEWWYKFQVTDNISVTPALFYLSRPLGQDTPPGQSFNQLGALIKTQFSF